MSQVSETTEEINHINVHFVQTKKFKTVNIIVKCRAPLARETITKRALLPYVLRKGTDSYPTERDLQLKLDSLYGSSLSIGGMKKGNNHIISFRLEIANDKFIPGESSVLDKGVQLLHEVIYKPKTVEQAFDAKIFSREVRTLEQIIDSTVDDKMKYANIRLVDEMCKNEPYALHLHGYKEDLETLTAKQLYEYYEQMLREDDIDIYVIGDYELNNMKNIIRANFKQPPQKRQGIKPSKTVERISEHVKPNTVIEKQDVQQAKLHIGYRTNCTFKDQDYFALQLLNGLLGGFPSSKLFLNVREKHSLAYYAASRLESHKGLIIVFSGIDAKNYHQAKQIIHEQVESIKRGNFSEEELSETKEQLTNQLLEILDHPQGTIELLYQQVLAKHSLTPNELIKQINQASRKDVIDVAKKLILDTVYLLTNKEGDESA